MNNLTGHSALISGLVPGVGAIVLLLAVGSVLRLHALGSKRQFEDVACERCHLGGADTTPDNASLLYGSLEQLCVACHGGAVEESHPSGLRPSMKVPDHFPLDWKGDLTCSSCHRIHALVHGQLRADLRGTAFCTQCHGRDFFEQMADGGSSLVLSGHIDANTAPAAQISDTYSIQCMTCHDDKSDTVDPKIGIDASNIARHRSGSMNHPVGVDYIKAAVFGGYRSLSQLPAQIVLPGGQISCISCHQGYSAQHGEVVVPQLGSNLCFQCHDL